MKTKRNKKAIIITAIIMLVGILLVLAGFFGGWFVDMVHNKDLTEWSCVYNLDDFTVSICLDSDYENVYTFSASDLK